MVLRLATGSISCGSVAGDWVCCGTGYWPLVVSRVEADHLRVVVLGRPLGVL